MTIQLIEMSDFETMDQIGILVLPLPKHCP